MSAPLGVGLIGAGPVTQAIHLPALAGLSGRLRVTHVMDVDAGTAEAVAARAGAAHSTTVEELLADPAVDVVAVCSPHQFHAAQAEAACAAGMKAVLVEKPFATGVEEARRIAKASQESGVPVVVGAMHTYDPAWLAVEPHWGELPRTARLVRSVIQLPFNARYESLATQPHSRPAPPPPADLTDPAVRAARIHGSILGLAIHNLPLVRRFLPEITSVDTAELLAPFGYLVTLRGPDGRTAELIGHMGPTWRPEWTFEVWGEEQELQLDFTPSYVRAGSATAALRTADDEHRFGPYPSNGYEAEWQHLADLAHRTAVPRYDVGRLVDDLAYAIDIADRAATVQHSEGAAL
ncbi:Gfo/Idh/MocA family oxidoreductase [Streptomyces prunicolor]|uniref:Gfo/Idh/MocA family protein n=1 Tax=Streptomyces prunicolor TaxID=67348 RepID=UPI00224CC2C9|nr:Gfo/Idh/MocA family oxidoreductase [Streptomyces prunicolor]MCX5240401.1 Gfo/Idh/MocA family oxidoreductase [Streptomyces prunicolor]